jgi:signal transduction histidine kinase
MAFGNDHQLVEIAAQLVPLAADGCTIDLVDDGGLICVAARHVDGSAERDLGDPTRRDGHRPMSRCAIVCGGEQVGEVVAWGSRILPPLGEALVCGAAGHVGAILEARRERRRAEEAEAARASIVAMVGHEIRAPLQALTVGIDLLAMRVRDSDHHVPRAWLMQRCDSLRSSVGRLADVTRRLLDISRLEAGPTALATAEDDLGTIVHAVVERVREAADWAGCPIEITTDGSLRGQWDRLHVETVVENLLTNAIKYGAGRPIAVTLEGTVHAVRIDVRDHGCGIAAHERERIFDRFFRGTAPGHHAGLGVGLWIVKKLVDAHGGTVRCESTEGEGATFSVLLPRDVSRADRVRERSESLREEPRH